MDRSTLTTKRSNTDDKTALSGVVFLCPKIGRIDERHKIIAYRKQRGTQPQANGESANMTDQTETLPTPPEFGQKIDDILKASKLNPMQQNFVRFYLVKPHATQAAKNAGYSPKTAKNQGSRLLAHVEFRTAFRDCKRARAKSLGTTKADIVAFHAEVLNDPRSTTREKDRAADRLSRLDGHYEDKVNVNLSGKLAEQMTRARSRKK